LKFEVEYLISGCSSVLLSFLHGLQKQIKSFNFCAQHTKKVAITRHGKLHDISSPEVPQARRAANENGMPWLLKFNNLNDEMKMSGARLKKNKPKVNYISTSSLALAVPFGVRRRIFSFIIYGARCSSKWHRMRDLIFLFSVAIFHLQQYTDKKTRTMSLREAFILCACEGRWKFQADKKTMARERLCNEDGRARATMDEFSRDFSCSLRVNGRRRRGERRKI
jgi:hypothetical protein